MGRIQILPAALASQIAAGEVVERPASAAKELIENALDAEATRCDVVCEGGGVSLLSVSDDGIGMAEEDARLCVERHATSKLEKLTDLNRLSTFGFRGEALPSIASVSRFTLRTRARDAEVGLAIAIEGGGEPKITREGMKIGTTIELRDLFFNVPARRKFLRSTGTESAHVTSALEGAALARPDVTFTLTRDGRKVRELLRVTSRRERVLDLLSEETLVEICGERGPLRLEAHLSSPERGRPGAAGLSIVVNGRIVKDRMLSATVAQAYGAALTPGHYPRGVVYLDLPPELVDVNVHPQKTEVRFVDPRALSDALYSILSRELSVAFALPQANRGARYRAETKATQGSSIGLLPVERPFQPGQDLKSKSRELALREPSNGRAPGRLPATQTRAQGPGQLTATQTRAQGPGQLTATQTTSDARTTVSSAALDFSAKPRMGGSPNVEAISALRPTAPLDEDLEAHAAETLVPPRSEEPTDTSTIDVIRPETNELRAIEEEDEPVPVTLQTQAVEALLGTVMGQLSQDKTVDFAQGSQRATPKSWGKLRFLAQVRLTFLVCEGQDGLYVIDQHAAAERVAFAKLLTQYQARAMTAQSLLFPVMVDLLPKETDLVDNQQEVFRALGLDVRVRGPERVSVHSVPRLLQHASPERLLRDLLGEMTKSGGRGFSSAVEQAIALMACHGSLRAGELLTAVQAQALLTSLDEVDVTHHCTHGRPVVAVMRFTDLERQVGRR